MAMKNKDRLNKHNAELAECVDYLSGKGPLPRPRMKDVNFYDYDGTLLYSYTLDEVKSMTALPPLPTRPGLICQEWNYRLETIKEYNRAVDVGATYITDDGKTRLYIKIAAEGRMSVRLYFNQSVRNGVTIDWGDGSDIQTINNIANVNTTHTYASIGEYVITLDVVDGCTLKLGDSSNGVLGYPSSNSDTIYRNMLQKVEIGVRTDISYSAFQNCYSLASIVIPNTVTNIGNSVFYGCHSLTSIVIPSGVTSIGSQWFRYCNAVARVMIPNTVTTFSESVFSDCKTIARVMIPNTVTNIGNSVFYGCYSLASIVIPNTVTYVGNSAFSTCYCMKYYDFSQHTSVPTLNSNAFSGIPSDCEIRVPMALVDEWKAATNWSTYANNIVGV